MSTPDDVPVSEQGDLDDHTVPADLLELHEALEALNAGFSPGERAP